MTLGPLARQLGAFVLFAIVVLGVTVFLELTVAVRQAVRHAQVESELVSGAMRRELASLLGGGEGEIATAARSVGVRLIMDDAIVLAPSVLDVAVLSPAGMVLAHGDSTRIGEPAVRHDYLPNVRGFSAAIGTLWELMREAPTYRTETALLRDGVPLATVSVTIAGAFLMNQISESTSPGFAAAGVTLALVLVAGIAISRLLSVRVHAMEQSVRAFSEGRFDVRVPTRGSDELDRLAHALNMLGDKFVAEGGGARVRGATRDVNLAPVLERLGRMASGVAHELRNQLQHAELELAGLGQGLEDTAQREQLGRARDAVQRLESVVRGYLRMAAIGAVDLRPTSPRTVLEAVAEENRARAAMANVSLEIAETGTLGEPELDAGVLTSALGNAVQNAIHALGDAGASSGGKIGLFAEREGVLLRFRVCDNGPGMSAEVARRAFDLYFTTREEGSGVGLPFISQAAELHGGTARIESIEGEGTTVILELPCATD